MAGPADRFNQRIAYAPVASRDARGQPTLGPKVTDVPARADPTRALMQDARGADFTSEWIIYTAAPIDLDFRVWPPGLDPDTSPGRVVRKVSPQVDGAGAERFREVVL